MARRWKTLLPFVIVCISTASAVRAQVMLQATIDAAQEVPAPILANPGEGGTATFTFSDQDKMLSFTVSLIALTATPTFAHIHQGPPGVAGPVIIPLVPTETSGTVGPLTDAQVTALFDGGLYINYHTPLNPNGEVRGQITLVPGSCSCASAASFGQFRSCVAQQVKQLDKSERRDAEIKALKRTVRKASCGKKHGPKKAIACCLPQHPEHNIVTGHLCAAVSAGACAVAGGTRGGASCFPANPCQPPAS
jgi:CHRD domain-containing protein